jgi:hypothetical protein
MTEYEETIANYRDIQAHVGGYVYESGTGHCMWSREPMTDQQLADEWAYIEENTALWEAQDDADYEPYYTLGAPRSSAW